MIAWIDAASGASGDMLLGALLDAGADEDFVRDAVSAVAPERTELSVARVRRASLVANKAHVQVAESATHRELGDVVALIRGAQLDPAVARHAINVFERLAAAEATVHGVTVDDVTFHEVGALDAIADIVGVCAGFVSLRPERVHSSPVALGSGTVSTRHGLLSIPPPAVALLLQGAPTYAGPVEGELCTPTGAALLRHWVSVWGPQPPMTVTMIGTGAGSKDFSSHPNVVRVFLGTPHAPPQPHALVYETNVDDLDPRLWPAILQRLLAAGASDAWLTPIIMKKGRPAYTLAVLLPVERAAEIREVVYAETSSIGLRESLVGKHALDRDTHVVTVEGQRISVKVAHLRGRVVNVQPEFEDVVAAARVLDRPVKVVLAAAVAAATHWWDDH